jgi:hypothetical protein
MPERRPGRRNVPPPTNKRDRHGAALWIDERDALTLGDRRWRPEIATEIESSQENRLYGQMSFADKRMRTFRAEMDAIYQAPTLADVRSMAQERAKATRQANLVANAKLTGAWNDLGALKRLLLDDLLRERNAFAESVMKDVEQRREEMK